MGNAIGSYTLGIGIKLDLDSRIRRFHIFTYRYANISHMNTAITI